MIISAEGKRRSSIRRRCGAALGWALLAALACGPAHANGIIDPQMKVLEDDFSSALTQGSNFLPNGGGGGVFGFFNASGQTITELTFETLLQPNLSAGDIASAFVCNQGNYNPFFLFCRIDYTASSGRLTIAFWGTNDAPALDHLGIAPLVSGCTAANADSPGCTGVGHFAISLNDDFSLTPSNGGWSAATNPTLFLPGGPTFTTTEIGLTFGAMPLDIAAVPEPGAFGLAAAAMAILGWIKTRRSKRA